MTSQSALGDRDQTSYGEKCARVLRVCVVLLCWLPQWVHAQSGSVFNAPAEDASDQVSLMQAEGDNAVTVPGPSEPRAVFDPQQEFIRQDARIMQLEQQLSQMQATREKDMLPGRIRSTDVPRLEDLLKTPAFPKVRLTGFFQVDAGYFSQDTASRAAYGDIEDVRGFRRARLAAVGDVSDSVSYMLEMDFAFPGRPSFMDVWFDVEKVPLLGNVRIGQFRQPFGMEELTSVRELPFLERSLSFGLNPFRQTGISFHNNNEAQTVTWAASVFGFPTDVWGDSYGDKGYGLAARVTALPLYADDSNLLHVGFDYCLTRPSTGALRYRSQPEFGGPFNGAAGNGFSVPFLVDTKVMSASSSNLFNWEAAGIWEQLFVQSEFTVANVDLTSGRNATFPSFYAMGGYMLTGEKHAYNKVAGVIGGIKPNCAWGEGGYGALELAARYSYQDLNSGGINGGRISDVTLGVNWYLNQYTKLQFNYIRAMSNTALVSNANTDVICARGQVSF